MKKHAVVDLLIEFREDNDLFDEFIADPVIFFEKHKLELTEAEKKYLLSVDKTTLYAYIQEGFDIRISKCLCGHGIICNLLVAVLFMPYLTVALEVYQYISSCSVI